MEYKFMTKITLAFLALAIHSTAFASEIKAYCFQTKPMTSKGYVIEELVISSTSAKRTADVSTLGIGILGPQGDGTASEGYLRLVNTKVTEDLSFQATSAAWSQAIPFPLISQTGAKSILYLQPQAFSGTPAFSARIKELDSQGKEAKSSILSCSRI
jgi:hypothetical protein